MVAANNVMRLRPFSIFLERKLYKQKIKEFSVKSLFSLEGNPVSDAAHKHSGFFRKLC